MSRSTAGSHLSSDCGLGPRGSPFNHVDHRRRLRVFDVLERRPGVPLLWLIYPEARYAIAFHEDGSAPLVREHEILV